MSSLTDECMQEVEEYSEVDKPQGGYDLEFLDKIPAFSVCPICAGVARNALQATCCGQIFCSGCVISSSNKERSHKRHRTCPRCRRHPMGHCYPDRNVDRLIEELHVKCANHLSGCEWTGELRNIKTHEKVCVHAIAPCPNKCGEKLPRHKLSEHTTGRCGMRAHACPECGLQDTFVHITTEHIHECPNVSIVCTNEGCEEAFKRKEKREHTSVCPKEVLLCPYMAVGCTACMKREELDNHKRERMEDHLSMAVLRISQLEKILYGHQKELQRLGRHTKVVLRMGKFLEREAAHEWWLSPQFYTGPCGYKLSVSASMTGQHLSAYLCIVKGEYDSFLSWPLRGTFTIAILNQLEDRNHHSANVVFHHHELTPFNSRVMFGRGRGYGFPFFITRSQLTQNHLLHCQYLKDNALFLSVGVVEVNSCTDRQWISSPAAY